MSVSGALSGDWTTLGLPLMQQLLFPMAIKVVDQVQVHGSGLPGCVMLDEAALARAAELGRNLAEQASQPVEARSYVGKPGKYPICNLNFIALLGGNLVECASCAAKGTLRIIDGKAQVDINPDGLEDSVFRMAALVKYGAEIKKVAGTLKPRMQEVPARMKPLLSWGEGITLIPPSLSGQGTVSSKQID